jgi:hypothetical protein
MPQGPGYRPNRLGGAKGLESAHSAPANLHSSVTDGLREKKFSQLSFRCKMGDNRRNKLKTSKTFRRRRRYKSDRVAPDCPRCGKATTRWRWPAYRLKAKQGKPVYVWWFQRMNKACRTQQIMAGPEALYDL